MTMPLSACLSNPRVLFQAGQGILILKPGCKLNMQRKSTISLDSSSQLFSQNNKGGRMYQGQGSGWSFLGGCRIVDRPNNNGLFLQKKRCRICSFFTVGTQFASCAFTLGTVSVLPFYTLMVFAPKSETTKKAMGSCIPYVVLGLVYAYLLYLSWTPNTIRLMFASKYWLPELHGIAKMFSSEMTLASAWIHLLVVDLFAARHVYQDGLKNEVETRHSVSLCLLTCPVGILSHTITKALIDQKRSRD